MSNRSLLVTLLVVIVLLAVVVALHRPRAHAARAFTPVHGTP